MRAYHEATLNILQLNSSSIFLKLNSKAIYLCREEPQYLPQENPVGYTMPPYGNQLNLTDHLNGTNPGNVMNLAQWSEHASAGPGLASTAAPGEDTMPQLVSHLQNPIIQRLFSSYYILQMMM